MPKSKRKKKSKALSERIKTFFKAHKTAFFILGVVVVTIIGLLPIVNGYLIINSPLENYTRYSSNTYSMTVGNNTFTADILCNLTSRAGFFCLQPIDVSATVIHDQPPSVNLTRLIFLESRDYPKTFFELDDNSDVWVPDGGSISLEYTGNFVREGKVNYVYEGKGKIFYDYEGEFTTILMFKEERQVSYSHESHEFIRPTLVVRTQAEYEQIKDDKVNLGLAWVVIGLTIWTVIIGLLSLERFKPKNFGANNQT